MAELVQTDKVGRGKASHYHIAYVQDDGSGETAVVNKHSHAIEFIQPQEAVTDPETGMEIIPQVQGGIVVHPAGKDNHTHELLDVELKEPTPPKDDATTVKEVLALYMEAKGLEKTPRANGIESEGFYDGTGHWTAAAKSKLESNQRAALTMNEIQSKVDLLSGYQRQNRMDIRFFPVEDGDAKVADILNVLVKNVLEQNNFEYVESEVFLDEAIPGRGLFNNYIDYDKNIQGDIIVEQFPWKQCYFGQHNKADASDCEYLVKYMWQSKAKLDQLWPEKADDIGKEIDMPEDEDPIQDNPEDQYAVGTAGDVPMVTDADLVNIQKKEYKTLECWRKEYRRIPVLVNIEDDFYLNAEDWRPADVAAVKSMAGFSVIHQRVHRMRVTTLAAKTLLLDEYPDLASDDFEVIPVYAKKRGNNWWGKVEGAKDPQREINKRHSQVVDILNKTAAYGWFYDSQTFKDKKGAAAFKKNSSSPGFNQEILDINNPPLQVQGVTFPSEVVNLQMVATQKLQEIMNVHPEMMGMNSNAESGIAIAQKRQAGMTGNEFLYDNLSLAKKLLGRQIVAKIQKVYDTDRILRILSSRSLREKIEVGGVPIVPDGGQTFSAPSQAQQGVPPGGPQGQQGVPPGGPQAEQPEGRIGYEVEELREMLDNVDLTKYDVVVGESAMNPTTRQSNFFIWMDAASKGMSIPPSTLVRMSDLPDKERVIKEIEAMQQKEADAERAKQQTEIQKTVIAKSGQPGGPS